MTFVGPNVNRRDADTSAVTDGQPDSINTNSVGRVKVSQWPGAYEAVTGTITTATSVVNVDVTRAMAVTVGIAGTYAGVNATFEVTIDGTNWLPIQAQSIGVSGALVIATGALASNATVGYDVSPLLGVTGFRVRATAYTSGTATVTVQRSSTPVEYSVQSGGDAPAASTDSGNPLKVGAVFRSAIPTYTDGQRVDLQSSNRGALFVNLKDGANSIGGSVAGGDAISNSQSGLWTYNLPSSFNGSTWDRNRTAAGAVQSGTGTQAFAQVPTATGLGLLSFQNTAVAATYVAVKASAGRVHRIVIQNPNTAIAWVQFYNATTATVGTTLPLFSIPVPASGIFEDFFPISDTFSTAIGVAATTTAQGATANTTALFVSVGYI